MLRLPQLGGAAEVVRLTGETEIDVMARTSSNLTPLIDFVATPVKDDLHFNALNALLTRLFGICHFVLNARFYERPLSSPRKRVGLIGYPLIVTRQTTAIRIILNNIRR